MAKLGPFELIRKLGAGATAEVFLASGPNARGEELIALKVMLEHLAEDANTRKAFLQEGRTAAVLRHPNIVEVFDVGEIEGRAYLAMELVRGWSVSALMKKVKAAKETLPFDEGCEIVRQAALGLHFAHEIRGADGKPLGLVHRDVSPQNLIVSERGEVKVADFGLAKATAAQATVTRGIKGKLKYMPPEQLKGEALDARSDVFALGAVLWELVTGQALYPGNSEAEIFQQALFNPQPHPDEVLRGLSRALVDVLLKSVEREPQRRFQSALALAEQLLPLIQPGESAVKLGALVEKHFEALPRSASTDTGVVAVTQPVKRRGTLPAPPSRLKPQPAPNPDSRESATIMSLPPVLEPLMDTNEGSSNPTMVQLTSPSDTLHDADGLSSRTFPTLTRGGRRPRKFLLPALVFAGIGIFTGAVVVGRYFNQRANAQTGVSSFEEIPLPGATGGEPTPVVDDTPARPTKGKKVREPPRGFVTIDANVPALVSVGGKDFGMTPVKVTLPIGKHRVKVATPDGAMANDLELTIIAGGNGRRTVLLR